MNAKTKLDVWNIDYIKWDDMQILAKNKDGEIIEFEEVPDEDLYEDGELFDTDVKNKIMKMMYLGKYKLIRRKDD